MVAVLEGGGGAGAGGQGALGRGRRWWWCVAVAEIHTNNEKEGEGKSRGSATMAARPNVKPPVNCRLRLFQVVKKINKIPGIDCPARYAGLEGSLTAQIPIISINAENMRREGHVGVTEYCHVTIALVIYNYRLFLELHRCLGPGKF
jgi:hypothetical protein